MAKTSVQQFVVCTSNEGYEASLEPRKIYVTLPDADAEQQGLVRVVDESGEDYLFPTSHVHAISLSPADTKAILDAA